MDRGRLPKRPKTVDCPLCGIKDAKFSFASTKSKLVNDYERAVYQYTGKPSCLKCKRKYSYIENNKDGDKVDMFIVTQLLKVKGITYSRKELYSTLAETKARRICFKR